MELLFHKKIQEKKFLIFQETETQENFLYFTKWNFSIKAQKIKKTHPEKISYISYIFSKESFFIFWETETLKKVLIFPQKKAFLIFREMETLKKFFCFRKSLFVIEKWKNPLWRTFLYFRKLNFPTSSLKNFLVFQKRTYKAPKAKSLLYFPL